VKRTPKQNHFAYKSSYRRNLPHIQPLNASLFLTFRLAGSLPRPVLVRMAYERRKIQESIKTNYDADRSRLSELSRRHFAMLESCLDNSKHGPTWLARSGIAEVVHEALRYRDGLDYRLECYSIMPNHVHVVFEPLNAGDLPKSLSTIMHSLKRNTARRANELLRRSGPFGEHETLTITSETNSNERGLLSTFSRIRLRLAWFRIGATGRGIICERRTQINNLRYKCANAN
jgi:REP element-mobilizing transposase RayT